jgi:hypothetical protein
MIGFSRFLPLPTLIALTLCALSTFTNAQTSPIQAGSTMPSMALTDQHEKPWAIPIDTRLVLFSGSRDANTIAQGLLSQKPVDYLKTKKTVYLSDMSKMPGFITRNFALPSMRDLPYSLGVVLNADETRDFPREDGALTAIFLDKGRVTRIEFIKTTESLNQALEAS